MDKETKLIVLVIVVLFVLAAVSIINQAIEVGIPKETLDSITYRTQKFWSFTVPSNILLIVGVGTAIYLVFKSDKKSEGEVKNFG